MQICGEEKGKKYECVGRDNEVNWKQRFLFNSKKKLWKYEYGNILFLSYLLDTEIKIDKILCASTHGILLINTIVKINIISFTKCTQYILLKIKY